MYQSRNFDRSKIAERSSFRFSKDRSKILQWSFYLKGSKTVQEVQRSFKHKLKILRRSFKDRSQDHSKIGLKIVFKIMIKIDRRFFKDRVLDRVWICRKMPEIATRSFYNSKIVSLRSLSNNNRDLVRHPNWI